MRVLWLIVLSIVACLQPVFCAHLSRAAEPKANAEPFSLHPDNPRYFLFRGNPTVLITSAEHYGLLLNKSLDYRTYLTELAAHGLNHSRVFSGAYREDAAAFNITENTLAPADKDYLAPWARTTQATAEGTPKWDLTRWDESYFSRLRDIVSEASKQNIVLELTLFCPMYNAGLWAINPMNARNNVNGIGNCESLEVYTTKHPDLLDVHIALSQKLVHALAEFDNVYFEVCNEPYFGGVTDQWQRRIIDGLVAAQREVGCHKLISLNIANGSQRVDDPHPAVSLFNFHYCHPPLAVAENWHLNKPIGENETGFRGQPDFLYRTEGWDFMLAGGALYNNLDYSFSVSHPAGTLSDYRSPGGGSRSLRQQLGVLKQLIDGLPLPHIAPQPTSLVKTSQDLICSCLGQADKTYLVYVHRKIPKKLDPAALERLHTPHPPVELSLELPAGVYEVARINPVSGERDKLPSLSVKDRRVDLTLPDFHMDAALLLTRQQGVAR